MQRKKMDITKIFQVILTLFYGQFISSAIFDNFIRTIPDLVENPKSFYLAIKVSLGVFIFCSSLFSLFVIWKRHYRLIFISGICLLVVFVTLIIITTIQLTLNYEKTETSERIKLIASVAVESVVQVTGIIITFFMSTRRSPRSSSRFDMEMEMEGVNDKSLDRRSRRSYIPVSTKSLDNGLDM